MFFFDFLYPGIGSRMAEPERLNNIWYQSFNQLSRFEVHRVGEAHLVVSVPQRFGLERGDPKPVAIDRRKRGGEQPTVL